MMHRMMKFITFASPLQPDFISLKFASIHASQQSKLPLWNTNSTWHMISDYHHVMKKMVLPLKQKIKRLR
jgi:hypothetical protein